MQLLYILKSRNSPHYYIGSTSLSLAARLAIHVCTSKKYPNRKLYAHFNAIGWDTVEILELQHNLNISTKRERLNVENLLIHLNETDHYLLNTYSPMQVRTSQVEYAKRYYATIVACPTCNKDMSRSALQYHRSRCQFTFKCV